MFYLAGPYTHENKAVMYARFKVMEEAACILASEGINVYSPIVAWHEAASQYSLPTNAHFWRKMNFDSLSRSDGMYILTLPGWKESEGVQMELGWAENKPHFMINYMVPTNMQSYRDRQMTLEI